MPYFNTNRPKARKLEWKRETWPTLAYEGVDLKLIKALPWRA